MKQALSSVAVPVLSVLLAFCGFGAAADRGAHPVRSRVAFDSSLPAEDWNPPAPHENWSHVVQSRTAAPRLRLTLSTADSYRIRIFYKLDGSAAGEVRTGGKPAARLDPGGWRSVTVNSPFVPEGEPWLLSFRVPEGGKLSVRRVDFRNYLVRVGSFVLPKPRGGERVPPSPAQIGLFLLALVLLGAWASHAGPSLGGGHRLARSVWVRGGGAGILLVLQQWLSPYPLHVTPLALGIFLVAVAGSGILVHLSGGGRALFRRAGLAAAGLLFALVLVEGFFWAWDPPISRPRIGSYAAYSEEYGWLNRPNTRGWQVDVGYHIRVNRHGHRGGEYPEKKPAGVFRILGLGDSFTFGWGVEERDIFLRVMERKLREAGHRVEVLNAGVPGWHSSQTLHYLRREGLRFEPDLMVMTFFLDDVFYQTIENMRKSGIALAQKAEEASVLRRKARRVTSLRLYNLWFNYRRIMSATRGYRRRNPAPTLEEEREKVLRNSWHENFEKTPANIEGLDSMTRIGQGSATSASCP